MKQNFELTNEGIELYNKKPDPGKVKLVGRKQTADFAGIDEVEKMVFAEQGGKQLPISWEHHPGKNLHDFTIEEVERKEQEGKVLVSWDGAPIGVQERNSMEVEIPSLKDFKILSAKVNSGEENYISVKFSDPLMEQ